MNNFARHPTALDLAEAASAGQTAGLTRHLEGCVECRIRVARLARARTAGQEPPDGALARIVDGVTRLPLPTEAERAESGTPRPGELWRVGRDEALLVWVRTVLDDAIEVMPVTLDADLADDQTLILGADENALGVELALLVALRAHVHPGAFLSWVADLPMGTADDVADVQAAAKGGSGTHELAVGAPVHDPDDQIVEYQQTLADLLADLGPRAWTAPSTLDRLEASDDHTRYELRQLLERDLAERHPCRIQDSLKVTAELPSGAIMSAEVRVVFADSCVVVAVLADWQSQERVDLASACRRILDQEPGSHAVAVCSPGLDWPTVVVAGLDTREAFEPPSGGRTPPRVPGEPLHVVDALAKYLDACVPLWEDVDGMALQAGTDLPAVARRAAQSSVEEIAAQGRRAHTPAKTQAWTALTDATVDEFARAVARIVAGDPPAEVLDSLIAGDQT